jgi:hypothetical protein
MRHPFLKFALPFMFRLRKDDADEEDFGNDLNTDDLAKAKEQLKEGELDPIAKAEQEALDKAAGAEAGKQGKTTTETKEGAEGAEGDGDTLRTAKTTADDPKETKEGDEAGKGKRGAIPLDRHEAILNREREQRRALEAQLAQFQNGKVVRDLNKELTEGETKVAKLETEYAELLAEGKTSEAVGKMTEIRKLERQMSQDKLNLELAASEARAVERTRFGIALERIEAAYPQLNEDHADYDKALMAEVVELKSAYEGRGMTPTDAMQKAVKLLIRPDSAKQKDATTVTPRVDKEKAEETDEDKAQAERDRRAAEARKKVADANGKQPPNASKLGADSDKLGSAGVTAEKMVKMTDKEFEALSDAELSALRGDTL